MNVPPPSQELLQAVAEMKPVAPRVPWKGLVWALLLSVVPALGLLFLLPKRIDLPWLSPGWVVLMGAFWSLAFLVPLALALLPRRGAVLPDAGRSLQVALVGLGLVFVSQIFFSRAAPGHTIQGLGHTTCFRIGLAFSLVPMLASVIALRRAMPTGGMRIGAAIGVAGASLGGFILHWVCAYGYALHTTVFHAGAVLAGLVLGLAVGAVASRLKWFSG